MAPNRGKNVWFVASTLQSGWVATEATGIKAAGAAAGMNITLWDGLNQPSQQAAGIQRAIAAHADAIVLQGINPDLVSGALADAANARIPVLAGVANLNPKALPAGVSMSFDFNWKRIGNLLADYILSASKCNANVGAWYAPIFAVQIAIKQGVTAEFKKLCPKCKVTWNTFDVSTWATALPQATASFIQSNPSVNYLLNAIDSGAIFNVQGAHVVGKKVPIVSSGGNAPNLDLIRTTGDQISTISWVPGIVAGWLAIDQVGRWMVGQKIPGRFLPIQAIDWTNVGKDDSFSQVFPKLANYEAQFSKAWKLSK